MVEALGIAGSSETADVFNSVSLGAHRELSPKAIVDGERVQAKPQYLLFFYTAPCRFLIYPDRFIDVHHRHSSKGVKRKRVEAHHSAPLSVQSAEETHVAEV